MSVQRLSRAEYERAVRAPHGELRRYLAGCRCPFCSKPSHATFRYLLYENDQEAYLRRFQARSANERAEASGVA